MNNGQIDIVKLLQFSLGRVDAFSTHQLYSLQFYSALRLWWNANASYQLIRRFDLVYRIWTADLTDYDNYPLVHVDWILEHKRKLMSRIY